MRLYLKNLTISFVFLAFLRIVGPAAAQETHFPVSEGELVRVTADVFAAPTVGKLYAASVDSLWLDTAVGPLVVLPMTRVQKIEVARKDRLKGALIGAPVGALALTMGLAVFGNSMGGWMCCGDFMDDLGFSAIFGAPIGLMAGGIAGAVIGAHDWTEIPTRAAG